MRKLIVILAALIWLMGCASAPKKTGVPETELEKLLRKNGTPTVEQDMSGSPQEKVLGWVRMSGDSRYIIFAIVNQKLGKVICQSKKSFAVRNWES